MTNFKNIKLKKVYDNSYESILNELIKPILELSVNVYRGTGFFSSSWIELIYPSLQKTLLNSGTLNIITSPQLSYRDYNIISKSKKADIIQEYSRIIDEIKSFDSIEVKERLLYLMCYRRINIRFATCLNDKGVYHDKVMIFEDRNGNKICIHGSMNDSLQSTYNGEALSVFRSWIKAENEYVESHFTHWKNLWEDKNDFYKVTEFPPETQISLMEECKKFNKKKSIEIPSYINDLHDYQLLAVDNLIENDWKGILNMATGTGKTITSIYAAKKYHDIHARTFLIVVVPYRHLVSQWDKILFDSNLKNNILCFGDSSKWRSKLKRKIGEFNAGITDLVCVVTTYRSASEKNFLEAISEINQNCFLIADECHSIGSNNNQRLLLPNVEARLGLSATPKRLYDREGTEILFNYFEKVVFEYDIGRAIQSGFLTPYEYEFIRSDLTEEEFEEYKNYSYRIMVLTNKLKEVSNLVERKEANEKLNLLRIQRSRIITRAANKLEMFKKAFATHKDREYIQHTIVYCAEGDIDKVTKIVDSLEISVHKFDYSVTSVKERELLLKRFAKGEIQVLVAVKCLDEGVDVPAVKCAYILASSSNPRQFVQRRGRILRKSPNKEKSLIIDFITFPPDFSSNGIGESLLEKEMARFIEFMNFASNFYLVKKRMRDCLKPYELSRLLEISLADYYERGDYE